jgi:hypothetical protein
MRQTPGGRFKPNAFLCVLSSMDLVARLADINPFGERTVLMARLQRDLPIYIAATNGVSIDQGYVGDFTKGIPIWWKNLVSEVGAWSEAVRIAFAMALNSAGAERVFSLLKILFGSNLDTALSDSIAENGGTKRSFLDYTAHFARKMVGKWQLIPD